MTLEERITEDMKTAMKAQDKVGLRGIRAIKAALLLLKTDGSGEAMTEDKEIKMIQKMVKQRKESHGIFVQQGREDLAAIEQEEIDIISKYLPAQLSDKEILDIVKSIVKETGAEGMKDMGKVMGIASQKLSGSADGKTLANLVKAALS